MYSYHIEVCAIFNTELDKAWRVGRFQDDLEDRLVPRLHEIVGVGLEHFEGLLKLADVALLERIQKISVDWHGDDDLNTQNKLTRHDI